MVRLLADSRKNKFSNPYIEIIQRRGDVHKEQLCIKSGR